MASTLTLQGREARLDVRNRTLLMQRYGARPAPRNIANFDAPPTEDPAVPAAASSFVAALNSGGARLCV